MKVPILQGIGQGLRFRDYWEQGLGLIALTGFSDRFSDSLGPGGYRIKDYSA